MYGGNHPTGTRTREASHTGKTAPTDPLNPGLPRASSFQNSAVPSKHRETTEPAITHTHPTPLADSRRPSHPTKKPKLRHSLTVGLQNKRWPLGGLQCLGATSSLSQGTCSSSVTGRRSAPPLLPSPAHARTHTGAYTQCTRAHTHRCTHTREPPLLPCTTGPHSGPPLSHPTELSPCSTTQ